jgi:hypothetical protein
METDPVSETSYFYSQEHRQWKKSPNPSNSVWLRMSNGLIEEQILVHFLNVCSVAAFTSVKVHVLLLLCCSIGHANLKYRTMERDTSITEQPPILKTIKRHFLITQKR